MNKKNHHNKLMDLQEAIVTARVAGVYFGTLHSFIDDINKLVSETDLTKSKLFGTLKVTHTGYCSFRIEDLLNGWGVYFSETVTLPGIYSIEKFTEEILKVALDKIVTRREEFLAQAQSYADKYKKQ